jgi:signal transduction histidine kinase
LKDDLARLTEDLWDVFDNLREVSHGIHPAILSKGGLEPALKALARRSPIPVNLDMRLAGRLPDPLEIGAYYVASEALANVAKHANATLVDLSAETRNGSLALSVRDDGIGGANPGGSGLIGLAERVEALGGALRLCSPRGGGTLVRVKLPLPPG